MPKIQIVYPSVEGAPGSLVVDGVDLSALVMRDGLSIDFDASPPVVTACLFGTSLDVTLPDGVVLLSGGDE